MPFVVNTKSVAQWNLDAASWSWITAYRSSWYGASRVKHFIAYCLLPGEVT